MFLERCDFCCDVLSDIDGGIVYELNQKAYEETFNQHICKDCLDSFSDEFELYEDECNHNEYVRLKDKK